MAVFPQIQGLGYAQLTTITTAVGLANGYSTVATVAVGNSGGTNYSVGDIVSLGGTGQPALVYVVGVTAGGVVSAVSLYGNWGSNPVSGLYVTGATPGTSNVATSNSAVANSAATGLTLNVTYTANAVPLNCQRALIQAQAQSAVWRDDGVAPTAAVGMVVTSGSAYVYEGNPSNLKVIQGTTGCVLDVYFQGFVGNVVIGH